MGVVGVPGMTPLALLFLETADAAERDMVEDILVKAE